MRKIILFALFVLSLQSCSTVTSLLTKITSDKSSNQSPKQQKELSIKDLTRNAKKGNAEAQCALGNCYSEGNGVEKDWNQATIWYLKAAFQNYAEAQYKLGNCYFEGNGIKKDLDQAVFWYSKAAEQQYADAQYALGNCYYEGKGVKRDLNQARFCYGSANTAEANYKLGNMYYNGEGLYTTSYRFGMANYYKAAEKGSPEAQKKLSTIITEVTKNVRTFTVKGVSFNMVPVQGGSFIMGASDAENGAFEQEKPSHHVKLSSFYIGQTEVTQELWEAVMGNNPSHHKGPKLPVENVSWEECQQFIINLNSLSGRSFRLPREAEWEFAAEGGNKHDDYGWYYTDFYWYASNSGEETHEVGARIPNELGIYDMLGNVYEWCADTYLKYSPSSVTDPLVIEPFGFNWDKVIRGGCCYSQQKYCRTTYRASELYSGVRRTGVGFRLAL